MEKGYGKYENAANIAINEKNCFGNGEVLLIKKNNSRILRQFYPFIRKTENGTSSLVL